MPSQSHHIIARRSHKKSRTGCQQCKVRKVKCDETWPLCRNCEKHFDGIIECDFPKPPKGSKSAQNPSTVNQRKTNVPRATSSHVVLPSISRTAMKSTLVHPDSAVPEAEFLMHHYFSNFNHKTFPMILGHDVDPFIRNWWEWATQDSVLFHATLRLSSLHLAELRGDKDKSVSKRLLNNECIRLLRERIEDPILSITDQTIGSLLFLIIIEFERGNLRMVRMHVEGLKRMVKLRGGLNAIGATNHVLANMIYGVTLTAMTEPQFSPDSEIEFPPRWGQDTPAVQEYILDFESLGIATTHARIISEVKFMSYSLLLGSGYKKPTPNYCSDVLSRVFSLKPPIEQGALTAAVSECAKFATLIACMTPFRYDYPNPTLMINVQLHKLKAALETVFELAPPGHPLLPWVLSIGCLWANEPERDWFEGQLIAVIDDLDMRTYEDFKSFCEPIIWIEAYFDGPFREIWDAAMAKRDKQLLDDLDPW